MLERNPDERLGAKRGVREIKEHPWLKSFPFHMLDGERIRAPFIPSNKSNFDQENIDEPWRDVDEPEFIQCQESLNSYDT